jgi:hypothetical protein
MIFMQAFSMLLLILFLLLTSLLAWLFLQQYVFRFFLNYGQDQIRLACHLGSLSRDLLSVFLYNQGRKWFSGIRTAKRSLWQKSWVLPAGIPLRRLWRLIRMARKFSRRTAWSEALCRFLTEVFQRVGDRQIILNAHMGLSSYPRTGYLAAVAYPLNYTLFRSLGSVRIKIIPDFSSRGLFFESQIRCTFRGYQLWKPSYHFLRTPEVRSFLWSRFSRTVGRSAGFQRVSRLWSTKPGKGGN